MKIIKVKKPIKTFKFFHEQKLYKEVKKFSFNCVIYFSGEKSPKKVVIIPEYNENRIIISLHILIFTKKKLIGFKSNDLNIIFNTIKKGKTTEKVKEINEKNIEKLFENFFGKKINSIKELGFE